ncbi:signal peptidase II [Thalassococcus sp. S3]|uniref:signal peptidase II n=1 Tax=Thalassococcus sp. S3 TaxID=2017482 RepID=UPI0010240F58|nr:signal peptidase II [Thalassococcus sp. S3]QBF33744.1 signal peptidase II [Thalassococcus sp. S3]
MRLLFLAATLAFAIDQISKYVIVHAMELSRIRSIDVLPPILNLRYGENRGINFGILDGAPDVTRWILVGFSILVVAGVLYWVMRWHRTPLMLFSGGLLIGGALGNVLDRVIYGYVLDFLNMSCCGVRNPFVFNLADVFIFAGAIGLILFDGKTRQKKAS